MPCILSISYTITAVSAKCILNESLCISAKDDIRCRATENQPLSVEDADRKGGLTHKGEVCGVCVSWIHSLREKSLLKITGPCPNPNLLRFSPCCCLIRKPLNKKPSPLIRYSSRLACLPIPKPAPHSVDSASYYRAFIYRPSAPLHLALVLGCLF